MLLAKGDASAAAGTTTAANGGGGSGGDSNSDSAGPNVAAAISAHRGREAARDRRAGGGLAPSLVGLLWGHQLPAALAAGVAAAALASEREAAASAAAMLARGGTGGAGGAGAGEEGPASAAAALVFSAVRRVTLRLLRGAGDPLSGALVFAGQPRSAAALAFALDPSALAAPVHPEGSVTMEALADGFDEVCAVGVCYGVLSAPCCKNNHFRALVGRDRQGEEEGVGVCARGGSVSFSN